MRAYIFLICLFFTQLLGAQTITIQFTGLRNNEGNIRLQVFNTAKGFDDEKPILIKIISKATLSGGKLKAELSGLKPGIYGIAILDDENANQKMDYGLILPKEGFGFSDYYHTGMSHPKFEQFDFVLTDKAVKAVEIKLRYL